MEKDAGIIITGLTVLGGIITALIKLITDYRKDHNVLTGKYAELAEKTLTSHNKLREAVDANTRATNRGSDVMAQTGRATERTAELILKMVKTSNRKKNAKSRS